MVTFVVRSYCESVSDMTVLLSTWLLFVLVLSGLDEIPSTINFSFLLRKYFVNLFSMYVYAAAILLYIILYIIQQVSRLRNRIIFQVSLCQLNLYTAYIAQYNSETMEIVISF